jgi:hypothetical protein
VAHNRKINKNYLEGKGKHRKNLRARVADIKEASPCMDCGFFYPAPVMEFDHRPGEYKFKTVAAMCAGGYSWEKITQEIAKCDLLCANCHRIRTHITRKAPKG